MDDVITADISVAVVTERSTAGVAVPSQLKDISAAQMGFQVVSAAAGDIVLIDNMQRAGHRKESIRVEFYKIVDITC